ncbi:helix-turn-helix domain-containing protein [Argonema antarcticum]|uniref:helix-turn-helix domain-containing protein n=1 Tax=Argonema antarcticum TaxID=2942763 RepID=UPI003B846936|nr:helix-turn-helix domain-containing protein [Argonema antarcticum A004/B2]
MLRSFQTRLELSDRQATVIARHASYSRWIYNWALRLCGEADRSGLTNRQP